MRAQAAAALVGWVDGRAVSDLIAAVGDSDADVRRAAAAALAYYARAGAKVTAEQKEKASSALDRIFSANGYPAIAGAVTYFIEKGRDGSEKVLIAALDSCGTEVMAEFFLNCGNAILAAAAEQWAVRNNYSVETWPGYGSGAAGAVWGSGG